MKESLESELELLRSILASSPDPTAITDLNGKLIECNAREIEVTGYSRDELIGKDPLIFIAEEERSNIFVDFSDESVKAALEQGLVRNIELTLVTKNGRRFPGEVSVSALRDRSGKTMGYMATFRDLTEKKRAQEELRRSKEMFETITERSFDVIATADQEGRVTYASRAAKEVLGYAPEEMVGTSFTRYVSQPDATRAMNVYKELMAGHQVRHTELLLRRKDGSECITEFNGSPILQDGNVVSVQVTFRDLTEQKEAEKEVLLLSNVAQQASDGIIVSDLEGKILFANKAWLKGHGFSSDEGKTLIGRDLDAFLRKPQSSTSLREKLLLQEHALPQLLQAPVRERVVEVRKDGSTLTTLCSLSLLKDQNGKPTGMIMLCRNLRDIVKDITNFRAASEEAKNDVGL